MVQAVLTGSDVALAPPGMFTHLFRDKSLCRPFRQSVVFFSVSLYDLLRFRMSSGLTTRLATQGGKGLPCNFGQGAFATPYSTPFLGTAVAYALTALLPQLWLLFMGMSLSLPWLLVVALPGLGRCLPRPRRWMMHLRTILTLLILVTTL